MFSGDGGGFTVDWGKGEGHGIVLMCIYNAEKIRPDSNQSVLYLKYNL